MCHSQTFTVDLGGDEKNLHILHNTQIPSPALPGGEGKPAGLHGLDAPGNP